MKINTNNVWFRALERGLVIALAALVSSLLNDFEATPVVYFVLRFVQDWLNKHISNYPVVK